MLISKNYIKMKYSLTGVHNLKKFWKLYYKNLHKIYYDTRVLYREYYNQFSQNLPLGYLCYSIFLKLLDFHKISLLKSREGLWYKVSLSFASVNNSEKHDGCSIRTISLSCVVFVHRCWRPFRSENSGGQGPIHEIHSCKIKANVWSNFFGGFKFNRILR